MEKGKTIRKIITEEQFNELKPFNKMAYKVEEILGFSQEKYWFQVAFEVTRDCDRYGFAILEVRER